jgi:hypothetical protein
MLKIRRRAGIDGKGRLWDKFILVRDYGLSSGSLGHLLQSFVIHVILLQISENIIEDEVTVGLFSEEECLGKFAPRLVVIGHLANSLDDYAVVGARLRIDRVDENLAILKADGEYLFVNLVLPIAWAPILALGAMDECRIFGVKAVKTVRLLVHKGVILGDKLPSNLGRF